MIEPYMLDTAKELLSFLKESPTAFQAVEQISALLEKNGFTRLSDGEAWHLSKGGKYYLTRNLSALIAFRIPETAPTGFRIAASHSDSPTYALKPTYEIEGSGYLKLNTERYGGMISSSWLDRPLSLAGRAIVKEGDSFVARPVKIDRDLLIIPNVAIHQNREINNGFQYNPAVDLQPLFGEAPAAKGGVRALLSEELGVPEEAIVGSDLYLYNRTPGCIFGHDNVFFASPRIDNLMCAYGTLRGFLDAAPGKSDPMVSLYAVFDNEETGSETKQGAGSAFLHDVLQRIGEETGNDFRRMLASSFMVSADNGHARHPNHPELSDGQNAPRLNGGVVIKTNSSQKYATEALSGALFREICDRAGVPTQYFANRSDSLGGSTLGSISDTRVPLLTVDIGMAQLAMHSSYETAGTADPYYLVRAMTEFFETPMASDRDGRFTLLRKD